MPTTDTLPQTDEDLPEVIEISPEVKAAVDAFFDYQDCMDRIRALQDEIRRHPDFNGDDRHFLDLAG